MNNHEEHTLNQLINKLSSGTFNEEESKELAHMLRGPNRQQVFRAMHMEEHLQKALLKVEQREQIMQKIHDRNNQKIIMDKIRIIARTAKSRKRFIRFSLSAIAALIILGITIIISLYGQAKNPALLATVINASGNSNVHEGQILSPSDSVVIPASGEVILEYPDKTKIELQGPAKLSLVHPAASSGKHLYLENGSILADVQKQPAGQALQITTNNCTVSVLGTVFNLKAMKTSSEIQMLKGTVKVEKSEDQSAVNVSAGEMVVAAVNRPLIVQDIAYDQQLQADGVIFALNCGGSAYKDNQGIIYKSDTPHSQYHSWTRFGNTEKPISNTADMPLYQSYGWNYTPIYYRIPLKNGSYRVTLKFAETYAPQGRVRLRIFDVDIENKLLLQDFNINENAGGPFKALSREFTASVNDGILEIGLFPSADLVTRIGRPMLCALVIRSVEHNGDKDEADEEK